MAWDVSPAATGAGFGTAPPGILLRAMAGLTCLLALTGILVSLSPAAAPAATLSPVVEGACGPAVFDGQRIAFVTGFTCAQLWSVDPEASSFTHLADSPLASIVRVAASNGTVVLPAQEAGHFGYYAVPTEGGAIAKLVDNATPIPGGSGAFDIGQFDVFNLDRGHLVFERGGGGVYTVPAGGGAVTVVGDSSTFVCEDGYSSGGIGTYQAPDVSGDTVAMAVTNALGEAAIYTAPIGGITGVSDPCAGAFLRAANVTRIASVNTAVPGDPKGRNFASGGFFREFPQVLARKLGGPAIDDGGAVVFLGGAADPGGDIDLVGIYASNAGVLVKLVDTNTLVPGGFGTFQPPNSDPAFPDFSLLAYAVSNGTVVFRGADAAGRIGLYQVPVTGGPIDEIVATGGILPDGRAVTQIPFQAIQPDSLRGEKLAFVATVPDPLGFADSIFLAELLPRGLSLLANVDLDLPSPLPVGSPPPLFRVGRRLAVSVGATNPGLPGAADLFAGMLLPGGIIASFTSAGGVAFGSAADLASLRPIAAGVPLAAPFSVTVPQFLAHEWTGSEPAGPYTFFLLATEAGALADGVLTSGEILAVTTVPFFFVP